MTALPRCLLRTGQSGPRLHILARHLKQAEPWVQPCLRRWTQVLCSCPVGKRALLPLSTCMPAHTCPHMCRRSQAHEALGTRPSQALGLRERGVSGPWPCRDWWEGRGAPTDRLLVPGEGRGDGGRGNVAVRAHFPLGAEQTEVSYWKAPRDRTCICYVSCIGRQILDH